MFRSWVEHEAPIFSNACPSLQCTSMVMPGLKKLESQYFGPAASWVEFPPYKWEIGNEVSPRPPSFSCLKWSFYNIELSKMRNVDDLPLQRRLCSPILKTGWKGRPVSLLHLIREKHLSYWAKLGRVARDSNTDCQYSYWDLINFLNRCLFTYYRPLNFHRL